MPSINTDYDGAWKEALEIYFRALLELCFPEPATDIDWAAGFEFLDQELQEIVRDAALGKQRVDKLIKVRQRNGRPQYVLVHCEIQTQPDPNLPKRLYQYHHRIEDRFGADTVTLAVLADDQPQWWPTSFERELWGCCIRFEFPSCKLLDLDLSELERSTNPAAIVIVAHLESLRTRGNMDLRLKRRWEMTRRLYESGFSKDEILQLYRLLDWLLILPPEYTLQFKSQLIAYEEERRMPYITSTSRMDREEGRQEGRQEGRLEALREDVLEVLRVRFEADTPEIAGQLDKLQDESVLRNLLRQALQVRSLSDFKQQLSSIPET